MIFKYLIFIFASAVLISFSFTQSPLKQQTAIAQNPTGLNQDSFKKIASSGKIVLVDFYATWCGPCKMVAPIVEDVKKQMGDSFILVKIDVDKNPVIKNAYKIDELPYLMLFKNGEINWNGLGMTTKEILLSAVRVAAKG